MILQDSRIKQRYEKDPSFDIDPFDPDSQLQPASVDMRLGETIIRFPGTGTPLDPLEMDDIGQQKTVPDRGYTLLPGEFILAATREWYEIPPDLVGVVHGRSSYARVGIAPHFGGFIDPGFTGHITLEITNMRDRPVTLHAGERFAQIAYYQTVGPASQLYDGKYDGATSVEQAKLTDE